MCRLSHLYIFLYVYIYINICFCTDEHSPLGAGRRYINIYMYKLYTNLFHRFKPLSGVVVELLLALQNWFLVSGADFRAASVCCLANLSDSTCAQINSMVSLFSLGTWFERGACPVQFYVP